MWDTGPGGVGVLYRPGMVVQRAARSPGDEEIEALWESGRWLHVHLAHMEGRAILNIQTVYGIVGQKRANAQLWKAVLTYTSRLGNAPQLICADCNFPLSHEGELPREVFTAFRKGLLVDIMRARAEARGQQPSPTYHGAAGAATRIDGVLVDPRVASLILKDAVIRKPGLPAHSLLHVDVDIDMACQAVTKIRRLEEPTEHGASMQEQEALAAALWNSVGRPWRTAARAENVNAMWSTWTWAAEEYLLLPLEEGVASHDVMRLHWRGPPSLLPAERDSNIRGRGTAATTTVTKLCPNKKLPSGAPKTGLIRMMDAIKGALKPVQRYIRARESQTCPAPGPWPREVRTSWLAAHRGLSKLHRAGTLPKGVTLPSEHRLPDSAELAHIADALELAVRAKAREEEQARVKAWRQWIDDSWAETPGVVYRWIRGSGDEALQMVKKADGQYTANIAEMDEVIRNAWKPINRRYENRPEPSVE